MSDALFCANCGPIPDQPLYDLSDGLFHALVTRPARLWGYFGPEPEEAEPCGPVKES